MNYNEIVLFRKRTESNKISKQEVQEVEGRISIHEYNLRFFYFINFIHGVCIAFCVFYLYQNAGWNTVMVLR
jgi:hypothetical protein